MTPFERVARLAATQYGVVSRAQLLGLGLTRRMIQGHLNGGRLVRIHPGVYGIAGVPALWRGRLIAAQLWLGDRCVVSHRSAGALWTLRGLQEDVIELTLPFARRSRQGVIVHTTGSLLRSDIRPRSPFLVTSVERTIVDLAAVLSEEALEEAVEDALYQRLTTYERISARADQLQRPGRRGMSRLARLLSDRDPDAAASESLFETRFYRRLRTSSLPPHQRQYKVFTPSGVFVARLDVAYPWARVGLEAYSERWHRPSRRQADMDRHNALSRLGWTILYKSFRDLNERPETILGELHDLLQPQLLRK